jgi:hypothetical protein
MQLTNEINLNVPSMNLCVNPKMTPLSDHQAKLLRQILLVGLANQAARKIPDEEIKLKEDKYKYKYIIKSPYGRACDHELLFSVKEERSGFTTRKFMKLVTMTSRKCFFEESQ